MYISVGCIKRMNKLIAREIVQSCYWYSPADSFIPNRYNARASTLLEAINYNVTPPLSNELRYRVDYRSVDYPDIGFAHFPLARPLYICISKYLEEKFTHHRQSFLDQQTKDHGHAGICKTNKTQEVVYRSCSFTSSSPFANLSSSPPPPPSPSPPLCSRSRSPPLLFPLFKIGQTSKCAVDRSQPSGLKRGSDKSLSVGATAQRAEREREEREERRRKTRGRTRRVWRRLRSEDKRCRWSRASLSKRSVGRTRKKKSEEADIELAATKAPRR